MVWICPSVRATMVCCCAIRAYVAALASASCERVRVRQVVGRRSEAKQGRVSACKVEEEKEHGVQPVVLP